jgi:hypothetical protein
MEARKDRREEYMWMAPGPKLGVREITQIGGMA